MDYTVALARDDDTEAVAALVAELINTGQRQSRRLLQWKYRENPFISSPLLFVIRYGSEVVGMRGMYGTCWAVSPDREATILPHADDLIIRADHRNRGLFLPLHHAMVDEARRRGFDAVLSLSALATTQELLLACGYVSVDHLETVRRPITSGRPVVRRAEGHLLRSLRQRGHFVPAFGWGLTVNGFCRRIASSSRHANIEVSSKPDHAAMSDLAASVADGRFGPVRSEAFLQWRLANPDHIYRFVYWRDSALRGYLVLSWDVMNPHRVTIADHAAENDGVFAELLGVLGAGDRECVMMSSTLSEAHALLAGAAGFVADTSGANPRRFLYYPLTSSVGLPEPKHEHEFQTGWTVTELDVMTS